MFEILEASETLTKTSNTQSNLYGPVLICKFKMHVMTASSLFVFIFFGLIVLFSFFFLCICLFDRQTEGERQTARQNYIKKDKKKIERKEGTNKQRNTK